MFYYGVWSVREKVIVIFKSALNPYLMTGDFLLFDTREECVKYWEGMGCKVKA